VRASDEHVDLLRALAPQVLGVLVRRYGRFDACEEAVQEALLAAAVQWPEEGVPESPRAWLITVAARRLADQVRSERARRRREDTAAAQAPADEAFAPAPGDEQPPEHDDTLTLLVLCCHPALSPASQLALTLRAVAGLTTAQIASAFLVPEATMAQRIGRAKQSIRAAGGGFEMPPEPERTERLHVVLHVLYLMFNEGYIASSGPDLQRGELTREAIRLTRAVHALRPEDGEVAGLLALMLLIDARRPARTNAAGELVPLAEQDRSLWDRALIVEGVALLDSAVSRGAVGEYQLQAAIAAVHDRAPTADDTDWPQILALYGLLEKLTGNPVVTLNRAVAVAMAEGPSAALALLDTVDDQLPGHYRVDAVRAHVLEMAGDTEAALEHYRRAASRTTNLREQRYLAAQVARLTTESA
jgi:RNA polymerase sigma factor (sigma-70 family)